MITREATYKMAFENKAQRLKVKKKTREETLKKAYDMQPRLVEIDRKLAEIGASIAITALSGNAEKLNKMKTISKSLAQEKKEIFEKLNISNLEYECEGCLDTGFIKGKVCDCIKKEAAFIMISELSKEMPLGESKFENFDLKYYLEKSDKNGENPRRRMTSILKLCKEYAINFSPGSSKNLLFIGNAGLGKTHLTLAIVSEVIKKGYLPIYGSAERIFSLIENEKFSGEGKGTYESISSCDLLVIDDLGAEMTTSFTKSVLYNLINTRILNRKPTIINTNLSMKEIESRYTARVSSRFIGEYEWNKFLGDDIRQQKLLNK